MDNPLLDLSGLPRFSRIRPEHVEPAVDAVLAANREVLAAAAARTGDPRWEDTIAPLEAAGHRLARVWAPVGHLNGVRNNPDLREAYNRCLPKLSDYASELGQDERLYRIYGRLAAADGALTEPRRRAVELALRDFRLAGVALPGDGKTRFRAIMSELSILQARFEEHLLDATNAWTLDVADAARLDGLPEGIRERAAGVARAAGKAGWRLALDFPTYYAVMNHATSRDLRRLFYEAWVTRASDAGPQGGRYDNSEVMTRILALRAEAAGLLGFGSYAEYSLASKMAESVDQVRGFLEELAARSRDAARAELAEVEALADHALEAWDVAFYSERLSQRRFDLTDEQLRPWLPARRVLQGLFEIVEALFGVRIRQAAAPDTWHPDVQFFEVHDASGPRGAFYVDLYARPEKRGGAWMDDCVGRARIGERLDLPVAFLVCNFMPASGDRPPLLTHDEAVTLFHEFGHTLHHLLTRVDLPSVAGINGVAWDAVELPSQFLENFAWAPEVLARISGHYVSGEPLPGAMVDRLIESRHFQSAMHMVRQLEFALFDLELHAGPPPADGGAILDVLGKVRRQVAVVPYPAFNRMPHSFSHIFGGGYAAGYYSYKWAEVLSADAFEAFAEAGVLDAATGRRFLASVLEVGGSVDPMEAFVAFRGRRPSVAALLRQSGIRETAEEASSCA